jgi:hypothetical protein
MYMHINTKIEAIADQFQSLPTNRVVTQTKLQTDNRVVCIKILTERQHSLLSIQIVMRVEQEKQGMIIVSCSCQWEQKPISKCQSNKQATDGRPAK